MTNTYALSPTGRRAGTYLLALAFAVLILFGLRTLSGSDIWFHLAAGRHVVEQGPARIDPFSFGLPENTPWRQTTWLYDLGLYGAWRLGGATLVIAGHVLAVAVAFFLLLPVARRYSQPWHQAVALLLCAWLLAPSFTVRPLVFCLLPLAAVIRGLDKRRMTTAGMVGLIIIQAVWTNLHSSFILGPLLALLGLIEAWRTPPPPDAPRNLVRPTVLLGGMTLATLLNPFGLAAWREAWSAFAGPDGIVVLEYISPFFTDFAPHHLTVLTTTALCLIGAVFIFRRERLPLVVTGCAALGAYTLTRSHDVLDLAALLIFPFIAMSLATISQLIAARMSVPVLNAARFAVVLIIGLAGLFSAGAIITNRYYVHYGFASGFGLGINNEVLPVAAVAAMQAHGVATHRLINLATDGGYLLWQLPGHRVYADPRGNLYGRAFFRDFARALNGHTPLPESDAILLNTTFAATRAAAAHWMSHPQWAVGYFDGTSLLLLRRTSINQAILENGELQHSGPPLIRAAYRRYEAALERGMRKPAVPARLVGAASVYQASRRNQEAQALYTLLTRGAPRMAVAWANRGLLALQAGDLEEAIRSLEHASRMVPGASVPWLWLSRAYEAVGRDDDAKTARQRAQQLDPALILDDRSPAP